MNISQDLLLDALFMHAPVGISISHDIYGTKGKDEQITYINPMGEKILGRSREELIREGWAKFTHPDDLEENIKYHEKIKSGEIDSYSMEKRFIRPDGSIVWVDMMVLKLNLGKDSNYNHLAIIQDITERKKIEMALSESERSKSVYLSQFPGMAYRCLNDEKWTMQYISEGVKDLTGYDVENLLYNRDVAFVDLIVEEFRQPIYAEWQRVLKEKKSFKMEYQIITASGEKKWVIEMGQGIYNSGDEIEALEGIILDISDRKKIEENLRYYSEHDSWTDLYNMQYLRRILKEDINKKGTKPRGLISINLSAVQSLIMSYGFYYVQDLIKKTAEALKLFATDNSLLFRTYENRFTFYIRSYEDRIELIEFSFLIKDILKPIWSVEGVGCGIGIYEIDEEDVTDIDEILKKLLIASEKAMSMYEVDFGICFYDTDMEKAIIREEEIKQELTQAVLGNKDKKLYLVYQPIIDVKTNKISSFEVLARLKSDDLGLIPPMEFIPIAEKTKLIVPMGQKVLYNALKFLKKLKNLGYKDIKLSINISLIEILRKDFVKNILDMINKMDISPKNISIEITESVLISNYEEINQTIATLQDLGFYIAIDDFGTGYSSLARGDELRVNTIKIDKFFIDKLLVVESEKAIVKDIISMIHKLGYNVIAEGVEDMKQWEYLKDFGCDKIQGYIISKPLKEKSAIKFLENFKI